MSEVVQMLSDTENVIPSPKQPPFLNASLLSSDETKMVSDDQNPDEVSASYTANSTTIYESIADSIAAIEHF